MRIFLPRTSLFRADRAFHVNPLAAAVRPGSGLELRDLVGFAAGHARLVHAVGLGDDHSAGGEARPTFVASAARHELECGAVAELHCFHAPTSAAASTAR